jgi:hypothetical protein
MADGSPAALVKQVDNQIGMILRTVNFRRLAAKEVKLLAGLRQNLADGRVYANDYELSETRDEQLDNAKKAKKYLEQSRRAILLASESDIFSAIDVAHLTALIDQLKADLK